MFKPLENYEFIRIEESEIIRKWTYSLNFEDFQAREDWTYNSEVILEVEFCCN